MSRAAGIIADSDAVLPDPRQPKKVNYCRKINAAKRFLTWTTGLWSGESRCQGLNGVAISAEVCDEFSLQVHFWFGNAVAFWGGVKCLWKHF
jgi:hypothetical protein